MMKKLLSLALAALMGVSALAACASAPDQLDPAITVASSDAATYAEWLDERLDAIPDDVVIGIGSNEAYGIDMANFEDDGYILREMNGDVLIFGATEDGTDRAVRKYAQAVEAGQAENLDEVYHEGHRIGRITLAGRDISEYTVYYPEGEYMKRAAEELSRLMEYACGAEMPVSAGKPASPYIELRYVTDESLHTTGYRYSVTADGMVIECFDGYKPSSPLLAVYRILENELDWFGLSYGDSDLAIADHIDIPAGTQGTETNLFQSFSYSFSGMNSYDSDRAYGYEYGYRILACHGLQSYGWGNNRVPWLTQPCYTDSSFTADCITDIKAYLDELLAAGEDFSDGHCFIDIAAPDANDWCTCKSCRSVYSRQGGAYSGAVITHANAVAEGIEAYGDQYRGVRYGVFAYFDASKPPKALEIHDAVWVTFCWDNACSSHTIDSSKCTTGEPYCKLGDYTTDRSNEVMFGYLKEWCEKTSNVMFWAYNLYVHGMSKSQLQTIYDDWKSLSRLGVKGIIYDFQQGDFGTAHMEPLMANFMQWNIDSTEEEFWAYYMEVLEHNYGQTADYMYEFFDALMYAYETGPCSTSWFQICGATASYNLQYYEEIFDRQFEIIETALPLAENKTMETSLLYLSCENIYKGCFASYFPAYESYDDDRVEVLKERYRLMIERRDKYKLGALSRGAGAYYPELELQAWGATYWTYIEDFDEMFGFKLSRPTPEWVKEYFAEHGT